MENDITGSPAGGPDEISSNSLGDSPTSPPLADTTDSATGSSPPLPPPPPVGITGSSADGGNANKTAILIAAIVLAVILIGGGIALAVALGGGSDDKPEVAAPASSTSTTLVTTTTTRPPTTTTTTIPAPILTKEMCTETASEGQFSKDSISLVGTCMHFWAYVFQFDANTGRCSLLARYGDGPARYNFDFEGGTIRVDGSTGPGKVVQSNAGRVQLPPNSCVQLGPIVEGDKIEIWGLVQGVQSYSTTAGGSNTYTVIDLVDAYKY
jgi:hypothetical protein